MKKDNKIVLSIIVGGSIIILLLLVGLSALIGLGSSNSSISISQYGDTVAIIPLQGEIAYGSSSITWRKYYNS